MSPEQRATRPPEYFETARNLGDVMLKYDQLTRQVVVAHQSRFITIVPEHESSFNQEERNPGSLNIKQLLKDTRGRVEWAVEPIVGQVGGILAAVAEVIPSKLSAESRQVLAEARSAASIYGISSRWVNEVLNKASQEDGNAIKAVLDADVLAKVKQDVYTFGVGSRSVKQSINSASTPKICAALGAALDIDVLAKARADASTFGASSRWVKETLGHASSKSVRTVFERQLAAQRSSNEGANQGFFNDDFDVDDFMKDLFRKYGHQRGSDTHQGRSSGSSRHSDQQRREQPRQEASQPRTDRDTEVDNVIARTVARNRQYDWIKHESPQDIRRIINTVRRLRADAEASGTTISDRKVYLKYRAKAETNPDLIKSVQILEALMGGDLNGNLPF